MKKYLPSIIAAASAMAVAVAPAVQSALAHHPTVTAVVAAIGAIIAHWLPSPTAQP